MMSWLDEDHSYAKHWSEQHLNDRSRIIAQKLLFTQADLSGQEAYYLSRYAFFRISFNIVLNDNKYDTFATTISCVWLAQCID